jgi:hypothetical protein
MKTQFHLRGYVAAGLLLCAVTTAACAAQPARPDPRETPRLYATRRPATPTRPDDDRFERQLTPVR